MRSDKRLPVHPGEVLLEEFLRPLQLTQVSVARHLGISLQRLNELVRGKRGVTPATAWLLSEAFSTTPEFWLNLQAAHDLARQRPSRRVLPLSLVAPGERQGVSSGLPPSDSP